MSSSGGGGGEDEAVSAMSRADASDPNAARQAAKQASNSLCVGLRTIYGLNSDIEYTLSNSMSFLFL